MYITKTSNENMHMLITRFQGLTLTLGGVPWIRGGVPVIAVDTPMTGDDDEVMMVEDTAVP